MDDGRCTTSYTPCLRKEPHMGQCYSLNNYWSILITFGIQHYDKTGHKWLQLYPPHLNTVATLPLKCRSGILADCNSDRSEGKYCFIRRWSQPLWYLTTLRLIHTSDNVSLSWPGLPSLQTLTGTSSEVQLSTWLHITHHRHAMMVIWPTSCTVRLIHWQISEWVSRHIGTIRQLYSAIHVGTHWKIQDRRQIKNRHYKN